MKKSLNWFNKNPVVKLFILNYIAYFTLVYNFRAVAQGLYWPSVLSDITIAALGFSILKSIQEANTLPQRLAYIAGGGFASASGIYVTKILFGH